MYIIKIKETKETNTETNKSITKIDLDYPLMIDL